MCFTLFSFRRKAGPMAAMNCSATPYPLGGCLYTAIAETQTLILASASSREKKPKAIMQGAAMTLCRDCSVRYEITKRSGSASVRRASITAYRNLAKSTNPFTTALLLHLCPSGRGLGEGFDLVDFLIGEAQLASAHDFLCLTGIAGPNDGSRHGRMTQRPGDCDFADETVVAVCY